jgi:hypothetical protein
MSIIVDCKYLVKHSLNCLLKLSLIAIVAKPGAFFFFDVLYIFFLCIHKLISLGKLFCLNWLAQKSLDFIFFGLA